MRARTGPFFLSLLLLYSSCARSGAVAPSSQAPSVLLTPSPYQRVPTGKSLQAITDFFLVDDFNTRALGKENVPQEKNRLGLPWETVVKPPGSLAHELFSEDALLEKRGGALLLKTSLPAGTQALFKSSLQGLDMSQAGALLFKCRIESEGETPFSGKLEVSVKDLKEKSQAYEVTSACLSGETGLHGWREALLPRSFFSGVDWNQLQEIAWVLTAGAQALEARIGIDEITFYGKGDIEFLSQRDNLVGFPARQEAPERAKELLAEKTNGLFLYGIARDTWRYFENAVDRKTQLPVDHVRVGEPGGVGSYTTPTNLAMYFLACVSAYELGIISKKEARDRALRTLETLRLMKRWKGFYYNFYHTGNLQVTRNYVSTVDSGWLAVAWVILRQAFPKELGALASRFLKEVDFYEFYDPNLGQLQLGFDEAAGDFSPYHYGLLATEARATSFVGIGKGDLPREHWWFIYRTPPRAWSWQNQIPEGKDKDIEGTTVFEGHYNYQGKKFVPSWGGSLFEFLMPALVMKEKELAPKGLGLNNRIATEIHIDYALNRQGYPVWGISPAAVSSGRHWRYVELGIKYLGVKGYRDEGVISPYAAFLALDTLPEHAIDNLRRMLELYPIYGEYGFYDSINVRTGRINTQYLALDQGMILAALANYLRQGVLKEHFHRDEIGQKAESLLGAEELFP